MNRTYRTYWSYIRSSTRIMDSFLKDIRYGIRGLAKRPVLTIIAIVTLGLGIGANSAIFSTINALLLKPLPFPDPERIVAVWEKVPSRGVERNEVALANYLDWNAQSQAFEHLGFYRWWSTNLTGSDSPERVQGFLVSANFLDIAGVKPMLGHGFSTEQNDPGKAGVPRLPNSLWKRRLGEVPTIVN